LRVDIYAKCLDKWNECRTASNNAATVGRMPVANRTICADTSPKNHANGNFFINFDNLIYDYQAKKNIVYGVLTFTGWYCLGDSFAGGGFFDLLGEWAGKWTVTINVFFSFALFITSLILWCSKKK